MTSSRPTFSPTPHRIPAFGASLCLALGVAACSTDERALTSPTGDTTDPSNTGVTENPLERASVSIGVVCGADGEQTVVVITEAQGGCAEHAALLAGAAPSGKSLVVEGPDLADTLRLDATAPVCEAGVCADADVALELDSLDATAGLGSFAVTLDGEVFESDFEAIRCDFSGGAAPLAADLNIQQVAIYQGTKVRLAEEGQPSSRQVPVVEGRPARLRVFVEPQAGFLSREIRAELTWDRGDGAGPVVRESTMTVRAASRESSFASSFDFDLSPEDVTSTARWAVALREASVCAIGNPSRLAVTPPEGASFALDALEIGDLNVVLVPVEYLGDGSGRLPDISDAQVERYREAFLAQYPVSDVTIRVREPLPWRRYIGPDGTGWSGLLQELLMVRAGDGASPKDYYYAIFQPTDSFRDFCRRGCVLGLAPLAGPNEPLYRGGIGLGYGGDMTTGTAVHEIAHAHGRPHAPCGVNDADPRYPYPSGSIGEWGYDILSGTLKSPEVHADFMSYCDPTWVSDYTYAALADRIAFVNNAQAFEVAGPPETWRMLTLGEDGATWGRTFETARPPAGEPVEVVYLDAVGAELEVAEGAAVKLDHVDGRLVTIPKGPEGAAFVKIDGVVVAY